MFVFRQAGQLAGGDLSFFFYFRQNFFDVLTVIIFPQFLVL